MKRAFLFVILLAVSPALHAQATNYCNNQIYQTFEGGTTGAQPGATDLQSSSHGGSAVTWGSDVTSTLTYSAPANDMRALVAPGRLCGDSTTYTNAAGSHALQMQFDGGADFFHVTAAYAPASDVIVSFEYNEDFAQTDGSKIDTVGIVNNLYGTIAFNAYGIPGSTRYYSLEVTGQAAPNITWTPSQSCPCKVTMHFRTGTASTGGNITLNVQDKNGVQLTPISVTSNVGVNTSSSIRFGDQCNCAAPTTGKHVWYDNVQISFDGSIPGQFCAGSSPTWTSSPDAATLQGCLTGATAGDTVNVLSGTATWNGALVNNSKGVSMAGATTCSNTGTASASCIDNTLIYWTNTTGNGFFNANLPASGTMTLSGLTFDWIGGTIHISQVAMSIGGSGWPAGVGPNPTGYRWTNSHIIDNDPSADNGTTFAEIDNAYGLIDHIFYQRLSGATTGMFGVYADKGSRGYAPWLTPLALGSTAANYFETSTWIDSVGGNTEGPYDGYAGCRTVFRFNYVSGTHNGGNHGTDSGPWRGCMLQENYGNTYLNNNSGGYSFQSQRSGTGITFGETATHSGSGAAYGAMNLYTYRSTAASQSGNDWGSWNGYGNGTKWTMNCTDVTSLCGVQLARNFPNWTTGNHPAYTSIVPSNSAGYVYTTYAACTSGGSQPATWNAAVGGSQADGGCTWVMSDGVAASGGPYGIFCGPVNLDTLVAVGGACPGSDTPTYYFDTGAGINSHGYPIRDQVGRVHTATQGQALAPVYAWSNLSDGSIVGFSTGGIDFADVVVQNRDYYVYPAGVAVNTLAALPASCTPGTGYFAYNEGNWNTSGNGFGSGALHICGAGGTFPATCPTTVLNSCYVPLAYPYPNTSSGAVTILPSSENFGSITIGSSSATQTATVSNTTTSAVTVSSTTTTGPNFTDFPTTANTCTNGSTIPANTGSCQVTSKFMPSLMGGESATLTVTLSSGPLTVALSGIGVSAGNPGASFSPNPMLFGNVIVNQVKPITLTITNTGTANLIVSASTLADTSVWSKNSATCLPSGTVTPGGNCTIAVTFAPTSSIVSATTLTVVSNAPSSPNVINLSGSGILVPSIGTGVQMNGLQVQ